MSFFNKDSRIRKFFKSLGPGIITGAADDDPSGIATYTQTGAQYGTSQLWTAVFMLPLMIAVQEISGRIGLVTGKGLAGVMKTHYTKKVLYFFVILLLIANTINLGADIGAMAESTNLFIPIPFVPLLLMFTALILSLQIFTPYRTYARILKWLSLSLLAYILTTIVISPDWLGTVKATLMPNLQFNTLFILTLVGVLGTSITPYMFFWEASQEVEEEIDYQHVNNLDRKTYVTKNLLKRFKTDNLAGMIYSEIITWFIIVTAAGSLHINHITTVNNAAQAASALKPLVHTFPYAGLISEVLFALGIVGTGLLAVPILAGSMSYALSESFGWKEGLYRKFNQARGFYGVISIATVVGLLINFIGIDPIRALFYAAIINGIIAVPLIFIMMLISNNKSIMGNHTNSKLSNTFGWLTFSCMFMAVIVSVITIFAK